MKTHFSLALALIAFSHAALGADRLISVSGGCTRESTPDRGEITVTAETVHKDLKTATAETARTYERVREAVKKLGLKDAELATSEYSVAEARDWVKNTNVLRGFRARMGLKVSSSEIQRLGEVIAIASAEQAKDVSSLRAYLSAEKLRSEQFACLQTAAEAARAKAEKLASSLGAKVGEVVRILESLDGSAPPMEAAMASDAMPMMRAKRMEAAPAVESGKLQVTASVSAIFQLK
jgi:hypothetical protein